MEKGRKKGSAIVVPLFYNVTPSQVGHPDQSHRSPFAEAFEEHERCERYSTQEVDEWKAALFTLSNLSGWSLQEDTNGWVPHALFLFVFLYMLLHQLST